MGEVIKNNESSLDNLKEIDATKVQMNETLKVLKVNAENSFYKVDTANNKISYDMNAVKAYLESIKDKSWEDLTKANTRAWILAVQIALEALGKDVGTIDGVLGKQGKDSQTKRAIRAFQTENGLTPDGVPGKDTIREILKKLGTPSMVKEDINEYEKAYKYEEETYKNIKESYVKIENNQEILGYKGKKICINLPAVGEFKGYNFECFISDDYVSKTNFEKNPDFENKSYSKEDMINLFSSINEYIINKFKKDGVYEFMVKHLGWGGDETYFEDGKLNYRGGQDFKSITGLSFRRYWLKDKNIRVGNDQYSYFSNKEHEGDDSYANLFLRLSD